MGHKINLRKGLSAALSGLETYFTLKAQERGREQGRADIDFTQDLQTQQADLRQQQFEEEKRRNLVLELQASQRSKKKKPLSILEESQQTLQAFEETGLLPSDFKIPTKKKGKDKIPASVLAALGELQGQLFLQGREESENPLDPRSRIIQPPLNQAGLDSLRNAFLSPFGQQQQRQPPTSTFNPLSPFGAALGGLEQFQQPQGQPQGQVGGGQLSETEIDELIRQLLQEVSQ